ncbi:MAG: hypothetical protein KC550_03115, partial [Nanoarchaeota archaeon]|nr:hypothetical protein [Nanoarchaeota archaeon]
MYNKTYLEIEKSLADIISDEDNFLKVIRLLTFIEDREKNLALLKKIYTPVIKPFIRYLNNKKWFSWGGLTFWDFFIEKIGILSSFHNIEEKNVKRYEFVKDFLESPIFDFKEPISNIVFSKYSKQIPLVFMLKNISENYYKEKVVVLNFSTVTNFLNEDPILNKKFSDLIDFIYQNSQQENKKNYLEFKTKIIEISKDLLCNNKIQRVFNENIDRLSVYNNDEIIHNIELLDICNVLLWNMLFDNTWRSLYFIPLQTFRKLGVGGLVLASKTAINLNEINKISLFIFKICGSFGNLYQQLFNEHKVKTNATKAAISAIMSRNMSHNLGSHVLSYLKGKVKDIPSAWESNLIEYHEKDGKIQIPIHSDVHGKDLYETIPYSKEHDAPFLKGLSRFINYLQERQDFIATISTDFIPYYSTVHFKDFIFDEINWDLRLKRHTNNDPNRATENILLDNIARSEDLDRSKISVNFKNFDGKSKHHPALDELRMIELELPGGIMGRQAIFSILENLLRNSAKHRRKEERSNPLILTFDIFDDPENSNYYKMTITDSNQITYSTLKVLHKGLEENFIDQDGRIIETNKGIKEIRISANWLIGNNEYALENSNNVEICRVLNILNREGILEDDGTIEKAYLRYSFKVQKPKKILFIYHSESDIIIKIKELKISDLILSLCSQEDAKVRLLDKNMNYSIIVFEECIQKDILLSNSLSQKAGVRQLWISTVDLWKEIESCDPNHYKKLYEAFYKEWVNQSFMEVYKLPKEKTIHISDKTDKNKSKSDFVITEISDNFENPSPIIFSHHNDEMNTFLETYKKIEGKGVHFIEGISGNNSTDRLIRNEEMNNLHSLKLIESAMTRVLIIDERIWNHARNSLPIAKDFSYLLEVDFRPKSEEDLNSIIESMCFYDPKLFVVGDRKVISESYKDNQTDLVRKFLLK